MNNNLKKYQAADTLGRKSVELVVKVYDGAISNLRQAAEAYKRGQTRDGYELIEKAKKFIVHLYTTLDEEKGQDIAKKLSQLYAYIIEKLNIVQATKDLTLIEEAVTILGNVREGWEQLAGQIKQTTVNAEAAQDVERPARGVSLSI